MFRGSGFSLLCSQEFCSSAACVTETFYGAVWIEIDSPRSQDVDGGQTWVGTSGRTLTPMAHTENRKWSRCQ